MHQTQALLVREFRLAPEYCRCAWYVVLGLVTLFCVSALLQHHRLVANNETWKSLIARFGVLMLPAWMLLLLTYRWRLRLDDAGLARRRLWQWDLWTWDEFESGLIQRQGNAFVSLSRPWWRNKLTLDFLRDEDAKFVRGACEFFFRPLESETTDVPDDIVVRYQLFFTVTLRKDGMSGHMSRSTFDVSWADVAQIRLFYFDHWSSELRRIELDFANRTLRIEGITRVSGPGLRATRGLSGKAALKIVEAFVITHVPAEKLIRHAIHGPPTTDAECDHRRRRLRRELRWLTVCYRTVPAVTLLLMLLCFSHILSAIWRGPGILPGLAWVVLETVLIATVILAKPLIFWAMLRESCQQHRKSIRQLDCWQTERNRRCREPTLSMSSLGPGQQARR